MPGFFDILYEPPVPFGDPYPLFTRVSLETCSACTRSCYFCPVDQRGPKLNVMPDNLYLKIVRELGALCFNGVVQWFYVNEPLLDKQHLNRINHLRLMCPKCTIHVTTNWDVHARKSFETQREELWALFQAGVNSLNINAYDENRVQPYRELVDSFDGVEGVTISDTHCWKRVGPRKRVLSMSDRVNPTDLHNWTGAFNLDAKGKGYCARPHRHIVVAWDGRVPLCCAVNPATMEEMGDVNKHTLLEVWNSRRMFEYRALLQDGCREQQCEKCNERMAFPHVVRRVNVN